MHRLMIVMPGQVKEEALVVKTITYFKNAELGLCSESVMVQLMDITTGHPTAVSTAVNVSVMSAYV